MIPAILIYLLKANIALTLFFLAYRLGLRRLTFYTLNRGFLLAGIAFSSLFPLIPINAFINRHEKIAGKLYMLDLNALKVPAATFTFWTALVYLFWLGVSVMAIRFFIQLLSLRKVHQQSELRIVDGMPVRALSLRVNPFSFFKNVYINPRLHQPEEMQAILRHEKVHVQQWHSVDVILGELNNIFYWFNPGAWLMKTAIRENLEFITDRYLLRQGVDKTIYQYSLIKVSGIPYATAIANNFNFSHLKNRIIMMNRKQSSGYQLVRYLALGALVGCLVLSLNYSRAAGGFAPASRTAERDHPVSPVTMAQSGQRDTLPPPPPPEIPAIEKRKMPPPPPPTPVPPPPPAPPKKDKLVITTTDGSEPFYLVDGTPRSAEEVKGIDPNTIESVYVVKDDAAKDLVTKYGEKASKGVVSMYTKQSGLGKAADANVITVTGASTKAGSPAGTITVTGVPAKNAGVTEVVEKVVVGRGTAHTVYTVNRPDTVVVVGGRAAPVEVRRFP